MKLALGKDISGVELSYSIDILTNIVLGVVDIEEIKCKIMHERATFL